MPEVLLIGVNHLDVTAPPKLEKALKDFSPDTILLEGSESRTRAQEIYITEIQSLIQNGVVSQTLGDVFIEDQKIKGFETRAAFEYGTKHDIDVSYFNDSFEPKTPDEIREQVRTLYSRLNADSQPDQLKEELLAQRAMIKFFLDTLKETIDEFGEEEAVEILLPKNRINVGERDKVMENVLRDKLEAQKLCAITGMAHIIRNSRKNSLICRIEDLNPRRKFLW